MYRTNLLILEEYHKYKNLKEFKNKCWDFYLLMGIELLEQGFIDEFIVWRLQSLNHNNKDIIFKIGKGKFIQKWVNNLEQTISNYNPIISFFRGGFPEYCKLTQKYSNSLGLKLYLGAGKRVYPQYGGIYDRILIEDEKDNSSKYNCIPFYKTINNNIFYPINLNKEYDICYIANFSQYRMKGQENFINLISKSNLLLSLKIIHIGNDIHIGKEYCKKYNVTNIEFAGKLKRNEINKFLNKSKLGIVTSTNQDGCPRVILEILMSGTPLLIKDETRLLNYYKNNNGIIEYNDSTINEIIELCLNKYIFLSNEIKNSIVNLSLSTICKMNWNLWEKIDKNKTSDYRTNKCKK